MTVRHPLLLGSVLEERFIGFHFTVPDKGESLFELFISHIHKLITLKVAQLVHFYLNNMKTVRQS